MAVALIRCTISATLWGSIVQNVIHMHGDDSDPDILENANLAMSTGFIPIIKTAIASQVVFFQSRADNITSGPGGPTRTDTFSIAGTGGSDDAVVPNIAFVITLGTGLAGRKNHGRIFVPGMRPTDLFHGLISSSAISNWSTPLSNLNLNFASGGTSAFNFVVHTRGTSPSADRLVTLFSLRATSGSMRTRMVGVGM